MSVSAVGRGARSRRMGGPSGRDAPDGFQRGGEREVERPPPSGAVRCSRSRVSKRLAWGEWEQGSAECRGGGDYSGQGSCITDPGGVDAAARGEILQEQRGGTKM